MKRREVYFPELGITHKDILGEMHYGNVQPEPFIEEQIEQICQEIAPWLKASYCYSYFNGIRKSRQIYVHTEILQVGNVISSFMKEASAYVLFLATAGMAFEKYMLRKKEEGDMLQMYIVNAIGTCIAEKCADMIEKEVEYEGRYPSYTNRFSPGYCDWPLSDQKQIFTLLKEDTIGITLSASSLMIPLKSISGLMGGGEKMEKKYGCAFCNITTCYKRKNRNSYD